MTNPLMHTTHTAERPGALAPASVDHRVAATPLAALQPGTACPNTAWGWQGPDVARSHYLAEAIDAHDLARRAAAWDRAQAIYRGL